MLKQLGGRRTGTEIIHADENILLAQIAIPAHLHGGLDGDHGQMLTLLTGESQAFDTIFAGTVQPQGSIPVTPDNVVIIAGLMVNELFSVLWKTPKLLDRCLVIGLDDFNMAFLDI